MNLMLLFGCFALGCIAVWYLFTKLEFLKDSFLKICKKMFNK